MKEERKKETFFLLGSLSRSWKKVDKETACVCEQGHPGVCGSCGTDYFGGGVGGREAGESRCMAHPCGSSSTVSSDH